MEEGVEAVGRPSCLARSNLQQASKPQRRHASGAKRHVRTCPIFSIAGDTMMDCETEMAADGGGSPVRPNSLFHHSSNDAGDASANESSHDAPDGADDCSDERAHPPDARAEAASGAAATNEHDMMLLKKFWRTYDTIIILSIFAVLGIVFRMMSATWFRLELGSVFSEDSALGTNLPLK